MNKNHITGIVIGAVVIAGASFWGGTTYAKGQAGPRGQFAAGQFGNRTGGGFRASTNGGVFGTIVGKDSNSITVQLGPSTGSGQEASGPAQVNGTDTGSKIVILDSNTQVGKYVAASAGDLREGQMVTVTGSPNSDGSVTAQTIQIRPAGSFGGRRGQ